MSIKNSIILWPLFFLFSCGSFEKERDGLLNQRHDKDLVNAFDIAKNQEEIFQVKEDQIVNPISKKAVESKPPKSKKSSKKEKLAPKDPNPISPLSLETPNQPNDFIYPLGYPDDLKKMDLVSAPIWANFRPAFYQGEQSIMAISYLGVVAGYVTISAKNIVKIGDQQAFHYYARFKSKDAYRYFYWLDDTIETFVDTKTFLPMKYSLIQREKKQDVDDLELFDFKKLKTYLWYKRVKSGSNKEEKLEAIIPRFAQDSFSALEFVRGLSLKKGDQYRFPVITRGKYWLLNIEVMGEENISVNGKDIKAYRIKAETHFPGVLQKSGDINFWYSMDEYKKLVKFQAKVKIGSIFGELIEYRPGLLIK